MKPDTITGPPTPAPLTPTPERRKRRGRGGKGEYEGGVEGREERVGEGRKGSRKGCGEEKLFELWECLAGEAEVEEWARRRGIRR